MKLYTIKRDGVILGWAGTQIDAKTKAKDVSGEWVETDVPTDKPGLLAFLNERPPQAAMVAVRGIDDDDEAPPPKPVAVPMVPQTFAARRAAAIVKHEDLDGLIEWLLDAAPWQVARIFEALGERMTGLLKRIVDAPEDSSYVEFVINESGDST